MIFKYENLNREKKKRYLNMKIQAEEKRKWYLNMIMEYYREKERKKGQKKRRKNFKIGVDIKIIKC